MVEDGSFIVAVWFFDIDVLKQEGLEDGWFSFLILETGLTVGG